MTITTMPAIIPWSKSQASHFKECHRKFNFSHHFKPLLQEGKEASAFSEVLFLKKIKSRPLWMGSIVHDSIGGVLKLVQHDQPLPSLQSVLQETKIRMENDFNDSLNNNQTNVPLFDHVYHVSLDPRAWQWNWEKAETALTWFMTSRWLSRLVELGPECWKVVDQLVSFEISDIQAYVKLDCAVEIEGQIHIMDWKTGALRHQDDDNMLVQALYAYEVWDAEPSQIHTTSVSLIDGETRQQNCNEDALIQTRLRIQNEAREMEKTVALFPANPMAISATDRIDTCRRCNFQKICHPGGL